jgi:predicted peptidase
MPPVRLSFFFAAFVVTLVTAVPVFSAETKPDGTGKPSVNDTDFQSGGYKDAAGKTLPYRLLTPRGYATSTAAHPLLIFLHGAGERGNDNAAQLSHGKEFMRRAAQDHGCFVLAPQCPPDLLWAGHHWEDKEHGLTDKPSEPMRLLLETVAQLSKTYRIDPDRLYIMGLSMGGFGVWDAIQRHPDLFAAAVPICSGGDETKTARLAKLPIWAFHGERDSVVPVRRSRDMIAAIQSHDGKPRYTEYPGVDHGSWVPAFNEPELLPWLIRQKRQAPARD